MSKEKVQSNIIIYTSEDGQVKLHVKVENETVWLTQKSIAELFNVDVRTVNEHLGNIYLEGELDEIPTVRNFRIVQKESTREVAREVKHYNLQAILSVGYRVNSGQGIQFRKWATERLREYIVKGFTMDDERLKQGDSRARYFQELLQRIRDIRSSERMFYQKVTDIYATSIDYKVDAESTKVFFATVQNKIHFAVHGHTAAEVIKKRVDSTKPLMGLMSFKGDYITAKDISIAKNYLNEQEINQLNLIVSLYLDFAELQAVNGRLMKMVDWIKKLDEFLLISDKKLLNDSGKVSAKEAEVKALDEYKKYRILEDKNYISDFDREVNKILKVQKKRK